MLSRWSQLSWNALWWEHIIFIENVLSLQSIIIFLQIYISKTTDKFSKLQSCWQGISVFPQFCNHMHIHQNCTSTVLVLTSTETSPNSYWPLLTPHQYQCRTIVDASWCTCGKNIALVCQLVLSSGLQSFEQRANSSIPKKFAWSSSVLKEYA